MNRSRLDPRTFFLLKQQELFCSASYDFVRWVFLGVFVNLGVRSLGGHGHGGGFNIRMSVVGFGEMVCEPDSGPRPMFVSSLHLLDDHVQVI